MDPRANGVYLWRTLQDSDLEWGFGFAACNCARQTTNACANDGDMERFIVLGALEGSH
jgi:hypothetical protein